MADGRRSLGFSSIGQAELVGARMTTASLPPFDNRSRCGACGNGRRIWVHHDPGCARVDGPHFHHLCPCGDEYLEAGFTADAGA